MTPTAIRGYIRKLILPINLLKRHTLRELDPAQRLQACFRAGMLKLDAKVAVAESDP